MDLAGLAGGSQEVDGVFQNDPLLVGIARRTEGPPEGERGYRALGTARASARRGSTMTTVVDIPASSRARAISPPD